MTGNVVVVGNGFTALDAARTALRLGATKVTLGTSGFSSRRGTLQQSLNESLAEGVLLLDGVTLNQIITIDEQVDGVEWVNDLGLTMQEVCGTVIPAGDMLADLDASSPLMQKGLIKIDHKTGETSQAGVFAGGDAVRPGNIIAAIVAGKKQPFRWIISYVGCRQPWNIRRIL